MNVVTKHTPGLLGSRAGRRRSCVPDLVHGGKQIRPSKGLSWASPSHFGRQTFFLWVVLERIRLAVRPSDRRRWLGWISREKRQPQGRANPKGSSLTKEILHHRPVRRACCLVSEYDEVGC